MKQSLMGVLNKVEWGIKQSLPNNKYNNKEEIPYLDNKEEKENNTPINIGVLKENNLKRFVKPSIDEIKAYCNERHNNIDPDRFYDFYESKGWKVGNTPMKDWKAAIRTWEAKNKDYKKDNGYTIEVLPPEERLSDLDEYF